jgi:exonuclease III
VKKGYSGTAILSKVKPLRVDDDLGIDKHDGEGRTITAEFDHFVIVAVYVPNSGDGLRRLDYRIKEWDVDFLNHLLRLRKER